MFGKIPYFEHNAIPKKVFDNVQLDSLSYVSLGDKIRNLLLSGQLVTGKDFDPDDYDQMEGSWDDPEPDKFDETNDISFDEIDALQRTKDIRESISGSRDSLKSELDATLNEIENEKNAAARKAAEEKAAKLEKLLAESETKE